MFTGLGGEQLWFCPSINQSVVDLTGNATNETLIGSMAIISDTQSGGTHAYDTPNALTGGLTFTPPASTVSSGQAANITVAMWADHTSYATNYLFSLGTSGWNDYLLVNGTSNDFIKGSVSGGISGNNNQFSRGNPIQHYVFEFTSTTVKAWVNGTLASTATGTWAGDTWDRGAIGALSRQALGQGSQCTLDDIRVYGRTITQAEITHLASQRGVQGGPYYKPLTLKSRVTRLLSNRAATLLERIRSASKPTTPISIKVKHNEEPSYKVSYAKNAGESENPHLWKGLVGAWMPSLGVTGDTLRDVSGNRNHGTLTGMDPATDWVTSEKGLALDFDGSDDLVNVGDNSDLQITANITLSAWIKASTQNNMGIAGKYASSSGKRGYLIATNQSDSNQKITWYYQRAAGSYNAGDALTSSSDVLDNNWHFVLCTFTPSVSAKIYIDGELDATDTASIQSAIANNSARFEIATHNEGTAFCFNGNISNVSIYNRALRPDEIQTLYVDSLAPFRRKKSPIGYQPIKELKGLIRTQEKI